MIKLTWVERANQTEMYHKERLRSNPNHLVRDTAKALRRSYGSVAEDLMLANWLKTHPKLEEIESSQEAIRWIRDKKIEMKLRY